MASAQAWYRFLGVRATEAATVWLFFLHNFFLGIGTILVYVTANVILLENHPQTSLPVAYLSAALAMMVVGRIYTHFEHHLILKKLSIRVLLAVIVMTFVLGLLVLWGHSVASAVAIMVGYRMIYLLTNLEFWGVSAVVFDVRQGKRLFSIISSGDMPAKALGALLSVVVHDHADLVLLLLTAFGAFGVATFVLRRTIRSHDIQVAPTKTPVHRRPLPPLVRQLFGGSELVFSMCLSLAAIACVVTSVEYLFFINVKEKFHDQADLMKFIGIVLMLTYLSALLFKLTLSWKTFERIGIRWSLALLPLVGLLGIVLFIVLQETGIDETVLLIYFCGLYLALEVLRRAVFDPIFLVLFQPLTPHTRLKGHTLVKGFYEPLGMALSGLLLIGLATGESIPYWVLFTWMTLCLVVAVYFLNRTYGHYLDTLKNALERRFLGSDELIMPIAANEVVIANLQNEHPAEVLNAIEWLQQHDPGALKAQAAQLLHNPHVAVRERTLTTLGGQTDAALLYAVATTDAEPALRQTAARWLVQQPNPDKHYLTDLERDPSLATQTGIIQGCLDLDPAHPVARKALASLIQVNDAAHHKAALQLLAYLTPNVQTARIKSALTDPDVTVQQAGIQAAGQLIDKELTPDIVALLGSHSHWRAAMQSLVAGESAVIPFLQSAVEPLATSVVVHRVASVCEHINTAESRAFLVDLAEQPNLFWRAAALRALRNTAPMATDTSRFQALLDEEWQLAQRLIRGIASEPEGPLVDSLNYELTLLQQRVFWLLMRLYDPALVANAQRGVAHAARDRRANALEMLDNLIPQPVYRSLQTLVDDMPVGDKLRSLTRLTTPLPDTEPIGVYIIRQGESAFTAWTISLVLRRSEPASHVDQIYPYLRSSSALIRESAACALQQPGHEISHLSALLIADNGHNSTSMNHHPATKISAVDRVVALKRTALFANTPENVLNNVVGIMNEVTYHQGQEIFRKGDTGTSLFIVFDGEVGIFNGPDQLATFVKGGFFGELALLDTELRSATAIALTDTFAFRIDQEDFYDLMEERGEVLQNIVRVLCQRLRRQNEMLYSNATDPAFT